MENTAANVILRSELDSSVNFITPLDDGQGFFEARYVRRTDHYFACYLSCQSGCAMRCKFCHLTATKQFIAKEANIAELAQQANKVLEHYMKYCPKAKYMHYNFMARGEPLMSSMILNRWDELYNALKVKAEYLDVIPKFYISTIMPKALSKSLVDIFKRDFPYLFYSLYSLDKDFRDEWLPNAMDPDEAFKQLKAYQRQSGTVVKLHWCFIKGANDSIRDIYAIAQKVKEYELLVSFNVVRYNPYDETYGEESPDVDHLAMMLKSATGMPVKIVTRVGPDVYASCGQFIS